MFASLLSRRVALAALAGSVFLLGGCVSDDAPPVARRAGPPPRAPSLAGAAEFFDGRIVAEVKVGALVGFDRQGDGGPKGGGPGGRHGRVKFAGHASAMGLRPNEGGAPGEEGRSDDDAPRARRHDQAVASPPVLIHLQLVNHGAERAEVRIADFLSPLGNFVITPDKLVLEPGQAAEVTPMASRLAGEVESGEISLRLKLGAGDETKVIALKAEPPAEER